MGKVSKTLTIIGGLTVLGGIAWAVNKVSKEVGFSVKGFGIPTFRSWSNIELPIRIKFNNPTSANLKIDQLVVDVFVWMEDRYVHAAHLDDRTLVIPAGSNIIEVKPSINLSNVFSNIVGAIFNMYETETLNTLTEVSVTFAGITFPKQTYDDKVKIPTVL